MAIVFTGDEFGDGCQYIAQTLQQYHVKASFFFTGNFYRNPLFQKSIQRLKNDGHYLGAHSNRHLLYADWLNRDSLLVTKDSFATDLKACYGEMKKWGIAKKDAPYFLPPFEWYNDSIAAWTNEMDLQLINFTPGTLSTADYTTPGAKNYRDSKTIFRSITHFETASASGLNGFILLMHVGTDAGRTDKFYTYLPQLLAWLKQKGYRPVSIKQLLQQP